MRSEVLNKTLADVMIIKPRFQIKDITERVNISNPALNVRLKNYVGKGYIEKERAGGKLWFTLRSGGYDAIALMDDRDDARDKQTDTKYKTHKPKFTIDLLKLSELEKMLYCGEII